MSEDGPSLHSRNLWARRTTRFLAILEKGLLLFVGQEDLESAEVDLNRRLYWCLLQATAELYPAEPCNPSLECNNQPDPDDEAGNIRELKRPDLQWVFRDRYEPDVRRSSMQFVVECKRLGLPLRADRVLTTDYVEHGIRRFIAPEWSYAKRFPSAAMVGYWQSMEADDVLREVNEAGAKRRISVLALGKQGWQVRGVSKLEHSFERSFPVSPFQLRHFWVDLR